MAVHFSKKLVAFVAMTGFGMNVVSAHGGESVTVTLPCDCTAVHTPTLVVPDYGVPTYVVVPSQPTLEPTTVVETYVVPSEVYETPVVVVETPYVPVEVIVSSEIITSSEVTTSKTKVSTSTEVVSTATPSEEQAIPSETTFTGGALKTAAPGTLGLVLLALLI